MNNIPINKYSIISIGVLCVTVVAFVLSTFLFSQVIPAYIHIITFVLIALIYLSARIWIRKVPDIKKGEAQALKMLFFVSSFELIGFILILFMLLTLFVIK